MTWNLESRRTILQSDLVLFQISALASSIGTLGEFRLEKLDS